ncbi:hypothetical protein V8F20_010624 [Naviculisporaceae sp. PSN 640]
MKQTTILSTTLGLLMAGIASAEAIDVVGKGTVAVLNGTNLDTLSLKDKIGCLDVNGALTLKDCAEFTIVEPPEYDGLLRVMSSDAGLCTFQNVKQPQNKDSIYGRDDYAWSCYEDHPANETDEAVYTLNGLKQPFICHGNINCFYDIKTAPTKETDAVPVWPFAWGSEQFGVPPGHLQVAWLWQPVKA